MRCRACGADNRRDAAFCLECGERLMLACHACGRDLPPSARFCDACGTRVPAQTPTPLPAAAETDRGGPRPDGERRTVTVLFIDAVSSMAASEALDEEELHAVVQGCTKRMTDAVNRFGGTVTQFRGDGIMAIFGAPVAQEDSARRAVSAALAMRDALQAYAGELAAGGRSAFTYRTGINSGPVVVGSIGELVMDYTAIGDTVNLAARMESLAPAGGIYITESTERAVAGYFELEDLGPLDVRGKSEPVRVYAVVRELSRRSRLEAAEERGLTPFLGREEQLRILQHQFERASAGDGQVVFVTGEAGMGKSRLLLEFQRRLPNNTRWLRGRCLSWGGAFPYLPIIELVRAAFGVDDSHDARAANERLEAWAGGWDESTASAAMPQLRYLLNIAAEGAQHMDPSERHAAILNALRALIARESESGPLVVAVEDLHWSDEQSEQALSALVDAVASLPVMVVVTFRPGYAHPLGDRSYFSRLALQNLAPGAGAAMVEAVLQAAGVPAELQESIVAKAEGNPFYIEEVSRSLIDSGVLQRRDGALVLARPVHEVKIPDTIQEVILSRLDRLSWQTRDVVQRASVIGREFPVRLLSRVCDVEHAVGGLLEELKTLELIYEKAYFPELAYTFKHALTQEVALSTLLTERRKTLHRTVAAGIEELYADRLAEHYEALSYHYAQGEDWEKSLDYATRVAERAVSLYAPRAAIEHLSRALEAAAHLPGTDTIRLHRERGRAYEAIGDFDASLADHERALALARERDEREDEWQAHADLGMLWAGRSYAQTGEHFTRAYEVAREMEDPCLIARSLNRLGNWRINTERPIEAIRDHEEALDIFRQLEDAHGIAETLDFLQMAYTLLGDLQRGIDSGLEAADRYRALGDRNALAGLLPSLALGASNFEALTVEPRELDRQKVIHWLDEALEISREIGWRSREVYALFCRALYLAGYGEWRAALSAGEESLRVAQEIGHRQWQVGAHYVLANTLADARDFDAAQPHFVRACEIAREIGSLYWIRCVDASWALASIAAGDLENAESILARSQSDDLPIHMPGPRGVWLARAEAAAARGEHDQALELLDRLLETLIRTEYTGAPSTPYMWHRRAESLAALGRTEAAAVEAERAAEQARAFGMRPVEARALLTVADVRERLGDNDGGTAARAAAWKLFSALASELDGDRAVRFLESDDVARVRSALAF